MELSLDESNRCQEVTTQLLTRTLNDCEKLGLETTCHGAHAHLDKKRWKKLQSQKDVTIYADRSATSAWLPIMRREEWKCPVAVTAVGRMECSLDDVLFSLMVPNSASQRLRSFLMDRRPERNCQLVPLVTPTPERPFEFLAISRFVNAQYSEWPLIFQTMKEMVVVIATGKINAMHGKRCGYELVQSISLNHASSMPRARVVQTRVFWEQSDGSIAIYTKLIVDAKHRIADSVTQLLMGRELLGFWKYVPRSLETKKLWWCVKNKKALIHTLRTFSVSYDNDESMICKLRPKTLPSKKAVARRQCEFCDTRLCHGSKCRVTCHLTMVLSSDTGFLEQTLVVCLRCAAFVRSRNSGAIARSLLDDLEQTSFRSALSYTKVVIRGKERTSVKSI
ncbi:hypothetical protein CCR75_000743 [Bremia lactucae]|uniref:Uncharacterized protein n=1 Tax=Bremia lactucae TaxID=4779 RepID=A0A976NYN9_BRELC|nr:hypothetical protein CCR75_000743 [Bremia lactucae]